MSNGNHGDEATHSNGLSRLYRMERCRSMPSAALPCAVSSIDTPSPHASNSMRFRLYPRRHRVEAFVRNIQNLVAGSPDAPDPLLRIIKQELTM